MKKFQMISYTPTEEDERREMAAIMAAVDYFHDNARTTYNEKQLASLAWLDEHYPRHYDVYRLWMAGLKKLTIAKAVGCSILDVHRVIKIYKRQNLS